MKIALIACMIFSRNLSLLTAQSKNNVHTFFVEQGLHDTPTKLQNVLQETIDRIEQINEETQIGRPKFEAIVLGYGLCSNGIVGLRSKSLPIIAPRCDDCMALFVGSQKNYLDVFRSHKGVYWFNKGWVEHGALPSDEKYNIRFKHYCEEYDEDTAEYLMEIEEDWKFKYESVCFVKSDILPDADEEELTKNMAEKYNWEFFTAKEDMSFLSDLIEGNWENEKQFLVCKPGYKIAEDFCGNKVRAVKIMPKVFIPPEKI